MGRGVTGFHRSGFLKKNKTRFRQKQINHCRKIAIKAYKLVEFFLATKKLRIKTTKVPFMFQVSNI